MQKISYMPTNTSNDEEPRSPSSYTETVTMETVKKTDVFSQINRQVTEADLQSGGTQRWLLHEHDKYEECIKQLDDYKEKYHTCDKARLLAESKLTTNDAFEVLYSVTISAGSVLIGIVPSLADSASKWLILGVGIVMVIGGISAKILTTRSKQ